MYFLRVLNYILPLFHVHMLCWGDKVGDVATHELRNMAYEEQLLPGTPTRFRRWSTSFRMKYSTSPLNIRIQRKSQFCDALVDIATM